MQKGLFSKLKIKPEHSLLILNAPPENAPLFKDAFFKAGKNRFDAVIIFARNKKELQKYISSAIRSLKEKGVFWICYPKKSSSAKTDITRDCGWESVTKAGFKAVSHVAIDNTWSALRFKAQPDNEIEPSLSTANTLQTFEAFLESPADGINGAFLSIPFAVEKVYGTRGQVKVKATFDGYPYRGVLANMGTGCHLIIVRKDIREAIGKDKGDKVKVTLLRDTEDRIVTIPHELLHAFTKNSKAKKFFETLSYTNRKEFVHWITSAKREDTKERRLLETIKKLLSGYKNPSEK